MSNRRYLVAADFPIVQGKCRVCGTSVPKGRQTTCGDACRQTLAFMTSATIQRWHVWKRDHGVCELCGFDAGKLARIEGWARTWRRGIPLGPKLHPRILREELRPTWVKPHWEMDHRIPVHAGGGLRPGMTIAEAMKNLRTLCHECHAKRDGHRPQRMTTKTTKNAKSRKD